jgi:tRNA threonylcarbamoyladenosine biosynthesis protein TsaB
MVVLALDTTTSSGSCAVMRDGRVLGEVDGDATRSHAARLPRDLMLVLQAAGLMLSHVDAFAVATGPGSFTGLRVGIATMQGLAFAARQPLFGVSALDALALAAGPAGRVATWVDAWRGDVYASLYEGGREIEPPVVGNPSALIAACSGGAVRFIGDGARTHWERISAGCGAQASLVSPAVPRLAGIVAGLAAAAAAAGQRPRPEDIRPLYVRRQDAELERDDRNVR